MAMYVSRWDAGRVAWYREEGGERRERERARARKVKNIESERVSEQTIVSFWSLLSTVVLLIIDNAQYYYSSQEKYDDQRINTYSNFVSFFSKLTKININNIYEKNRQKKNERNKFLREEFRRFFPLSLSLSLWLVL